MFSESYKRYVLGALTLVYTLNFCDRGVMALALQSVKTEFHLSDTRLGFLTGLAFALFYATLGLPMARWADRGDRVTLTSLAIGLWGLTVMACLFVGNFIQLIVARVAAAVGEAGCMPPTYSLVGDYFPGTAERPRAMAIYMLAGPLASLLSFAGGGFLTERYGWRVTFFLIGIPALLVALVVRFSIAEPRARLNGVRIQRKQQLPLKNVLKILWHQRSFRHLSLAYILLSLMGYGLGPWYAAFMMRSHGMGTAEFGLWFGLIVGVTGIVGTLAGGYVAGRWFAHDERGQMRLSAVVTVSLFPGLILFLTLPQKHLALVPFTLSSIVWAFFFAPTFALMQRLVVDEMRATTLALVMLFANLIGMGLGPQIVGVLSDLLMPALGSESLRYSMLVTCLVALWAACHFWLSGRTVLADLKAVADRQSSGEPALSKGVTAAVVK